MDNPQLIYSFFFRSRHTLKDARTRSFWLAAKSNKIISKCLIQNPPMSNRVFLLAGFNTECRLGIYSQSKLECSNQPLNSRTLPGDTHGISNYNLTLEISASNYHLSEATNLLNFNG